jgi:hypothetical protein
MADTNITVTASGAVIQAGAITAITAGSGLTGGTITSTGTIAADIAPSGGGTATQIVGATDSRLTNARTPTAHAASHAAAGSDPITVSQSQVTNLTTDLAAKVSTSRQILAGTGLTGGGNLTADRTLAVSFGSTASDACVGNDARLSNSRTPTSHAASHAAAGSDPLTLSQSQITNLTTDLAGKAALLHASTHGSAGSDPITIAQSQVTSLVTDLSNKVATSRQVIAGTGLTGGGNLTADRTFAVSYGTLGSTACEGNDSRLSDARTPTGAAGGDLNGTYPNPTVDGLQGVAVQSGAPTAGDALVYVSGTAQWEHQATTDVQVFTSSGTWTKPAGCKRVEIICIGGGGGGGSGHAHASSNRGGGGGGGGGGISQVVFRASDLPATLTVTRGAGGAGGAGVSANNDGNDGTAGGASSCVFSGVTYAYAQGGNLGAKGTNSGGAGGATTTANLSLYQGGAGGAGGTAGAGGTVGTNALGAPGGGGGAGLPSSGVVQTGGSGGIRIGAGQQSSAGVAGTAIGWWGNAGGGSSSSGTSSSAGGAGIYGSGGGGSGAAVTASGAGGAGGNGVVVIISEW